MEVRYHGKAKHESGRQRLRQVGVSQVAELGLMFSARLGDSIGIRFKVVQLRVRMRKRNMKLIIDEEDKKLNDLNEDFGSVVYGGVYFSSRNFE
ncbi:hypothetical protein IFM89_019141 [Coptis chinensis]|uniref:Uncharacterized protein n=1 Tax=Coptis chinensis TaxID=261450 RepID=A0A835H475_9MAGN|nr:hypothetical protein IFM89_019141 [Coptis chinensis]